MPSTFTKTSGQFDTETIREYAKKALAHLHEAGDILLASDGCSDCEDAFAEIMEATAELEELHDYGLQRKCCDDSGLMGKPRC